MEESPLLKRIWGRESFSSSDQKSYVALNPMEPLSSCSTGFITEARLLQNSTSLNQTQIKTRSSALFSAIRGSRALYLSLLSKHPSDLQILDIPSLGLYILNASRKHKITRLQGIGTQPEITDSDGPAGQNHSNVIKHLEKDFTNIGYHHREY